MQDLSANPTRIAIGNYRADVLQGGTVERFWYYVIQRKDSNKIIDLAKFESYEQAMEAARKILDEMNRKAATG